MDDDDDGIGDGSGVNGVVDGGSYPSYEATKIIAILIQEPSRNNGQHSPTSQNVKDARI